MSQDPLQKAREVRAEQSAQSAELRRLKEQETYRLFNLWADQGLFPDGPGFYAQDAHEAYVEWLEREGYHLVLGPKLFALRLEVERGLERCKRRGRVFFRHTTLRGGRGRRVHYTWKRDMKREGL